MYEDIDRVETKKSYTQLKEVISSLNEPICILGGWAVFFHVNKRFENAKGEPFLGSRDIDLGFSIGKNLKNSSLTKVHSLLIEKRFVPADSGLKSEIFTEMETVGGGVKVKKHFLFPIYVDFFVDEVPNGFKKKFGFNPIHEPLLKDAFGKGGSVFIEEFGRKLLLPSPELLLSMKVNSLSNRDKQHLRIKDICDIFVLAKYSSLEMENINLRTRIPEKTLKKCLKMIKDSDFNIAGEQILHGSDEIKKVITQLLKGK